MNRTVSSEFWIGDVVYLKTRDQKVPGMVTGVTFQPREAAGDVDRPAFYFVTWPSGEEFKHFACELTSEYVPTYDADLS